MPPRTLLFGFLILKNLLKFDLALNAILRFKND
jgi:hypothetical protein